jgi:GNAT superfamily N-acetyltransferase
MLVSESLLELFNLEKVSTYKKFIELKRSIRDMYPNVNLVIDFYRNLNPSNYLYLHKIGVPEEYKNQGVGTKVMQILCEFADRYELIFKLSPTDFFGSDLERLTNFYRKFGFEMEENSDEMIREPKNQIIN